MAWIRSDCSKLSDEWYLTKLTPAERNAFDLFILRVKAEGARGSVAMTTPVILAAQWFMDESTVKSMLKKANGKIEQREGRWYVVNWKRYQEDYGDEKSTTYRGKGLSSENPEEGPNGTTPPHPTPQLPHKNIVGWFEEAWGKYPNKQGRSQALRHYQASVKSEEDRQKLLGAMQNYLRCERVSRGFLQNGSTWFNGWRDWVSPTPEMMGRTVNKPPPILKTKVCRVCHHEFDPYKHNGCPVCNREGLKQGGAGNELINAISKEMKV